MTDSTHKDQQSLWDIIDFPKAAYWGKRVPKKHFVENDSLPSKDRKLIRENVGHINWVYTLKPETCKILPYKDDERDYPEIAVLNVALNSDKSYRRIAEILHRVIPYPLIICLRSEDTVFSLSIAHKRFSLSESGAVVSEAATTTEWLREMNLSDIDRKFMQSLSWSNLPQQNYKKTYDAIYDAFIAYECSAFSGNYTVGNTAKRVEILSKCREIDAQKSELRAKLKKASFNAQVELNVKIKTLEHKRQSLTAQL